MGFEDFAGKLKIIKEQRPEKSGKNKKDEPKNKSRRLFLKGLMYGAAATATGVGLKELFDDDGAKKNKINKIDQDKTEEPIEKQKKDEKKEIKIEIKNIADIFLQTYYELSSSEHWPPTDVVSTDFYIGQQLQESGLNREAESWAGARGIMQNMAISIKDTVRYLNKLSRNTAFDYKGPKELDKQQMQDIMDLLFENADYSRAFGKLYLCALWDQKWGYRVGKTHYDKGNIKEAQQELLGSYNGGYKRVRQEPMNKWPSESRQYAKKISNYMERLGNIRDKFNVSEISLSREDYAAALMAREMDKPKGFKNKCILLDKYTKKIKEKVNQLNRDLTDEEIRIIFENK